MWRDSEGLPDRAARFAWVGASVGVACALAGAVAAARLTEMLGGPADLVMSDMAANATGHKKTDHLRIIGLAETAAEFAREVLGPGGAYLAKVLQGGTEGALLTDLKRDFASVRHIKPPASRADSSELYVLATGYRGPVAPTAQE